MNAISLLPLWGLVILVVGFVLRWNPLRVVVLSAAVTGLLAGMSVFDWLSLLGEAFARNRYLLLFILIFPCIGLLESAGMRERLRDVILVYPRASFAHILSAYHFFRQTSAAFGLISLGGHAQTVRPLLAPLVLSAAQRDAGELPPSSRDKLLAWCAATDNVALFFGEDIFLAFGGVLLMQGFLAENGYVVETLSLALWAIPTALAAFAIQNARLWWWQWQWQQAIALHKEGAQR